MTYSVDELLQLGETLDESDGAERRSVRLAREFLRIRDRSGGESALEANPVQLQFERDRKAHNIILKARQMGITTWVAGRFFLKTITARGVLTVQVAHTLDAAQSIFRMVQRFYDCLPEEWRKGALKRSRANVRQMVFPELDSEFRVLTAADPNCGRGLTISNMHLSEVSRWPGDAAATLAGLRAALVPGGELVMESTPNGACGCFYEEWQQAAESSVQQHFFPWWMEPAYVSAPVTDMREDELELVRKHNLSPAQIGYRRGLESRYRGMRVQEYAEDPELCFRTFGDCCFELEPIERRLGEIEPPVSTRYNGTHQVYLPPQPGRRYIVAVDPAGGGSEGDYAAVQVIDVESGMQCAEMQRRLRPSELAAAVASLGREYSTGPTPALLAVERNNHGHGVLAHLAGRENYAPLFEMRGHPGWDTSSTTRPEMVAHLGSLLADRPELFRSRRLLEECRTFVNRRDGKAAAANGAHDDCVMAMAIAQSVRSEVLETGRARG